MVDLLSMFRRRPVKRGPHGFARSREDITALGDTMGDMLSNPVRDAPPIARGAARGAAAPLVLGAAFAGGRGAGFSVRGNSKVVEGAARASGGASRSGLDSMSPMLSPSAVMSSRERAKPLPRFTGRRRNIPSKSIIPALTAFEGFRMYRARRLIRLPSMNERMSLAHQSWVS